jgi:hypothetical protein
VYDSKGQLTSAKHTWADGEFLPGQQFEYTYDDIGNRLQARLGGDQNGNALRQTTYLRNNLNQYTSRSVPAADRKVGIMGLAFVDNGVATSVTIESFGEAFAASASVIAVGTAHEHVSSVAGPRAHAGDLRISRVIAFLSSEEFVISCVRLPPD